MKRIFSTLLAAIILTTALICPIAAYAPGEAMGWAIHSDVRAFIDGYPIKSYNINWKTYVVAEDLLQYGFNVEWRGDENKLIIHPEHTTKPENYTATYEHTSSEGIPGTPAVEYIYTDTTVWIGDKQIEGYDIGGYTCICMDDLAAHFAKDYVWDGDNSELRMAVENEIADDEAMKKLQRKGDEKAIGCALTVLRDRLKVPNSLQVLEQEIIDKDEWLRYEVKIKYSAQNSMGGYVTDYFYVLLKVNSIMNGTFEYYTGSVLGYDYRYLDSDKEEFGWGTKPDDFTLVAVKMPKQGELVSVKQIVAYPEKYDGMYVTVVEDLVVTSNSLKQKYFRTLQSTGSGKYDYNTDCDINVYYSSADSIDECIMLDADYQKIRVSGYVKVYTNTQEACIDAMVIEFLD